MAQRCDLAQLASKVGCAVRSCTIGEWRAVRCCDVEARVSFCLHFFIKEKVHHMDGVAIGAALPNPLLDSGVRRGGLLSNLCPAGHSDRGQCSRWVLGELHIVRLSSMCHCGNHRSIVYGLPGYRGIEGCCRNKDELAHEPSDSTLEE